MSKARDMLGLARRAGKISAGHDAVISSIVKNRARLCIITADASDRLLGEILHATTSYNKKIKLIKSNLNSDSLSLAIGTKAKVITIDDENFARPINSLFIDEGLVLEE